jgi:hypothetical protein
LTAADLRQRAIESSQAVVCDAISWAIDGLTTHSEHRVAQFRRTPLVLEASSPDFSTDAGNSALIAVDEISAPNAQEEQQEREEKQQRDFPTFPIWPTREGTPCHGESSPDVNSLQPLL